MTALRGHWGAWAPIAGPASITIGVLDGVHRGHQALIDTLDPDMTRTVLTFDPHPLEVLRPGLHPRLITTIDERVARLREHGVDQVGVLHLGDIKDLEPEVFVNDVLVDKLNAGHLVVGKDFRFGKDRGGDVELLRSMGPLSGFGVEVIELVSDGRGVLSSSRIRAMIESGEVGVAADALGAPYRVTAPVVEGDKRGREIGFPTANMTPPARKVIPAVGIYAARCRFGEEEHPAAVNVGVRPTFGGGELVIEAFILDFSGDLYGEELSIDFLHYLRPELAFDSVDELVGRMKDDVARTRELLGVSD